MCGLINNYVQYIECMCRQTANQELIPGVTPVRVSWYVSSPALCLEKDGALADRIPCAFRGLENLSCEEMLGRLRLFSQKRRHKGMW